ncbi:unnamed protein product [Microthlaspi erraticum]|uniref:Uncharacterized protein n=1 Tax=Microthlaspi erraticum TaxID=1685480 RepID=A0A6D2IVC3_9BRAS|nr:unnamed protein product [Microthlaspi erraticum]CAA7033147.1 unnamed protein product [Microthlaspi erraticum]
MKDFQEEEEEQRTYRRCFEQTLRGWTPGTKNQERLKFEKTFQKEKDTLGKRRRLRQHVPMYVMLDQLHAAIGYVLRLWVCLLYSKQVIYDRILCSISLLVAVSPTHLDFRAN